MKIFIGNGCPLLGYRVVRNLNQKIGEINLIKFSDGEIGAEIMEHVRGEDVYIVQSTSFPANDNLMELAVISDSVRRSGSQRIVAVIPYYGYSRADRRLKHQRMPITSKLVADLLQVSGISMVVTVDIHSEQQQGFFSVPFINVSALPLIVENIKKTMEGKKYKIVSPDIGGVKRARDVAVGLGPDVELIIIDKDRPAANHSKVMNIIGNVEDSNCILVDDIVDTAGTLCQASNVLKENGALEVFAYCTHPVLSGDAIDNINSSSIDRLYVTDTISLNDKSSTCDKIEILSVSSLLGQTIDRISTNQSISEIYKR